MQNWDMSLFKNIPLGSERRTSASFGWKAFNAFNHPNFNDKFYGITVNGPWEYASPTTPLTISKNSNWGTPADTYSGGGGFRVVQLGAKLYF